jgi:hypothetical protein
VATLQRKVGILRQHCADVGRDPDEIEVSVGVPGDKAPEDLGAQYREEGASLFTVGVGGPEPDLSPLSNWIAWRDGQNS